MRDPFWKSLNLLAPDAARTPWAVQANRLRLIGPNPGEGRATVRALARGGQAIIQDDVAVTLDQLRAAVRAERVLIFTHLPRQVAGIHVPQPGLLPDLGGADEVAAVVLSGSVIL